MLERRVIIPPTISSESLRGATQGSSFKMEGATMGTNWRVHCTLPPGLSRSDVYGAIEEGLQNIVRQMSHFDSDSTLCKYNRALAGDWIELQPEFAKVMEISLDVAAQSDGAYSPALGELIDAYGFGAKACQSGHVSVESIVSEYRPSDWRKIRLQMFELSVNGEADCSLPGSSFGWKLYQPGGVELNLSSVAKGYAVDVVSQRLLELGVNHHLVEIGGELRGHGCKPDGTPWWCTLEKPPAAKNLPETVIALCDLAVATSGDVVQQRLTKTGERISHLVDPRNGRPASDALATVTVLNHSCGVADAWATALYVVGMEAGLKLAKEYKLAAIFTRRGLGEGGELSYSETLSSELEAWIELE